MSKIGSEEDVTPEESLSRKKSTTAIGARKVPEACASDVVGATTEVGPLDDMDDISGPDIFFASVGLTSPNTRMVAMAARYEGPSRLQVT